TDQAFPRSEVPSWPTSRRDRLRRPAPPSASTRRRPRTQTGHPRRKRRDARRSWSPTPRSRSTSRRWPSGARTRRAKAGSGSAALVGEERGLQPGDLEDLAHRLLRADDPDLPVAFFTESLVGADEHSEAGRIDERHARELQRDVDRATPDEVRELGTQPGRRR